MISRLGRFEITSEIGRGGFGQVFHAHDPVMNRVVAIKVLTATEDGASLNRFKNEAIAAGNLHHENIVTVYEFGLEGQVPFLVMEYIDGDDLQHTITANHPLSLYQKVRIMDRVADGLHCAHLNGVLHRDVKPANVMITRDGGVKIMDFGIARLVRDTSTRLTQQGYLIGTVVYMAPELFSGDFQVDALCDIWSYGVVMYELLSGKNPFRTGSLQSEMYRILNTDAPLLPSDVCPPDLQAVIQKLLQRNRDARYRSLEETRFDLQPILQRLKKTEANRLVSQAQQAMFEQQWTAALAAARDARKMDAQNVTARIIFERVQDELRKQVTNPRVEELLRRSGEAASGKDYAEAIRHLNAALEIDASNEKVLFRLRELNVLQAKAEEAANLVSEASEEFHAGRLTDAFKHASEAVTLDPENQEGRRLFESVQSAIHTVRSEREVEAEILRARGLMAIDDAEGAMKVLEAAQKTHPGNSAISKFISQVSEEIKNRQQRSDFARRLSEAKAGVRAGRFAEAVQALEQLRQSFPNESEVLDLLAYANHEQQAKAKSEELKRIADQATERCNTQQFLDAMQILEEGLQKYPEDQTLTRLLGDAHSRLENSARENALRVALQRCETLRRDEKWSEAFKLVVQLRADHPENPEIASLDSAIRAGKTRAERAAAIRTAVEQAEKLLREGQADAAVKLLEATSRTAGPDPVLDSLLEKAEDARQAERERGEIESELNHAKVFEERGDLRTSLKIIENALLQSPSSPGLLAAQKRLSAAIGPRPDRPLPAAPVGSTPKPTPEPTPKPTPAVLPVPAAAPAPAVEARGKQKWLIYGAAAAVLVVFLGFVLRPRPTGTQTASDESKFASKVGGTAPSTAPAGPQFQPASLTFSASPSGIPPQSVVVKSSAAIANPKVSERWVQVTRRNGGASGTAEFVVQVSPNGLPPGVHEASLQFANAKPLPVTLMIPGGVTSGVSPAVLVLSSAKAEDKVTYIGPGEIPDPTASESWLTFKRDQASPGRAEFLVAAAIDELDPGSYTADLTFPSGKKVLVKVTVASDPDAVEVKPDSLEFHGAGESHKVAVTGTGDLPTPTVTDRWVKFTRHDLGTGFSEFEVEVNPAGLTPGPHVAYINFTSTRKVRVLLNVPAR